MIIASASTRGCASFFDRTREKGCSSCSSVVREWHGVRGGLVCVRCLLLLSVLLCGQCLLFSSTCCVHNTSLRRTDPHPFKMSRNSIVMGMREFEGNGCILADDMGLGKTLQSIAVLWTLLKQGKTKGQPAVRRAIVVCPTSLVKNWEAEIDKWLKVCVCMCVCRYRTGRWAWCGCVCLVFCAAVLRLRGMGLKVC